MTEATVLPKGGITLSEFRAEMARDGLPAAARRLGALAEENPFGAVIAADFAPPADAVGPLAGIPIAVKDNIDTLPYPTTGGAPGLKDNLPAADAWITARLRAAGAWFPAKLNLHELAFGITSDNGAFGPVTNPFDPDRTAGGSSGGSGAALAAGIAPVTIGTDTGASIRIPASFCGAVGMRPSTGRYPADGILQISWMRDTPGFLANCVADIAELDAVLVPDEAVLPALPDRPLRLGLAADVLPGFDASVEAAFRAALGRLAEEGIAEIVPLPAIGFRAAQETHDMPTATVEAHDYWQDFAAARGLRFDDLPDLLGSPDVRAIFEGMPALAAGVAGEYRAFLTSGRSRLQARIGAVHAIHALDALVMPTCPVPPPRRADYTEIEAGGERRPTLPVVAQNVSLATLIGTPSITLPCGTDGRGLPAGLLLDGQIGADRRLLAIAGRIEAILCQPR